jgi:hypothetical protein
MLLLKINNKKIIDANVNNFIFGNIENLSSKKPKTKKRKLKIKKK